MAAGGVFTQLLHDLENKSNKIKKHSKDLLFGVKLIFSIELHCGRSHYNCDGGNCLQNMQNEIENS